MHAHCVLNSKWWLLAVQMLIFDKIFLLQIYFLLNWLLINAPYSFICDQVNLKLLTSVNKGMRLIREKCKSFHCWENKKGVTTKGSLISILFCSLQGSSVLLNTEKFQSNQTWFVILENYFLWTDLDISTLRHCVSADDSQLTLK